jgi:hypothetical protein
MDRLPPFPQTQELWLVSLVSWLTVGAYTGASCLVLGSPVWAVPVTYVWCLLAFWAWHALAHEEWTSVLHEVGLTPFRIYGTNQGPAWFPGGGEGER